MSPSLKSSTMPQQLDVTTSLQKQVVDEKGVPLRKKSERRKDPEDKGPTRRRKDETEDGKRPARQPRRRSTGNQPSEATAKADLVSPLPVTSRESKSQRPRSSRQGSTSRIQGDAMSPRSVKREKGSSSSAHALAPSSRDSPRRARPRCTKTAEASLLPSTSIKMRERRSSLPSAASIRSPFKRSRERRPSLSSNTWMNTAPKLDPEVDRSLSISEKAPSRRMHRRRTIASGRVDTDSSSEEQPIEISKPTLTLKKVSNLTNERTGERTRTTRRASVIGCSSESTGKLVESSGKNLRSRSTRNASSKSLGVSPQQPTKPSTRRSRSSSMQHVSLLQSDSLKSLSGEAFRQAFVSVNDKGSSSTEGVPSNSTAKASKTVGRTTLSASKPATPRKSKTSSKEKRLKPLSNGFDDNDSIVLNDIEAASDVENGEGFFAVRSFLYEQ